MKRRRMKLKLVIFYLILEIDYLVTISDNFKNEKIIQLENCLNLALRKNDEIRSENKKLQHCLMALENENESIGEYVALYRFQRSNIQKKITEKELDLLKLQQYCQFYEVFLKFIILKIYILFRNNYVFYKIL